MNWQLIIIIVVFIAAIGYLIFYLTGKFKKENCTSCGLGEASKSEAIRKFKERVS